MPEDVVLAKAELRKIELPDGDKDARDLGEAPVVVDFNPETLRVTYSNTVEGKDQRGGSAKQYVGKSSTKLAVELWFDVTADTEVADVREKTKKVNQFMVPKQEGSGKDRKFVPPGVRLIWGSFLFDGVMESMDETLELFSPEGRPLRAKVGIAISSQDIQFRIQPIAPPGGGTPGTQPQQQLRQGESVQQAAGRSGNPEGWQGMAERDGIENPRRPERGALTGARGR